jgi:hypothetical protein
MNLLRQIQYSQNWNVGFCFTSADDVIINKGVKDVKWLNHPYKDRWFADPFIYSVTEKEIIVFVEELLIEKPKGYLVELVINKQTMTLVNRYVLLDLSTHLSYPAFFRYEGKLYVCPENGASGKLNCYEYDEFNHKLINPICILHEALADSTILQKKENEYYLITTKVPEVQEKAYLYKSCSPIEKFTQVQDSPIQKNRNCSRPAGNWFYVSGLLYRPAQDCVKGYGNAVSIMQVDNMEPYKEHLEFTIKPLSFKYNLGIHTINFFTKNGESLTVVDGYGYYRPILGRIYYSKVIRVLIGLMKKFHHFFSEIGF